jgi:hypothetical protein
MGMRIRAGDHIPHRCIGGDQTPSPRESFSVDLESLGLDASLWSASVPR